MNYARFREKLLTLSERVGGKKALAKAMGWTTQTLSHYLHGRAQPGRSVIERLAKVSGQPVAAWYDEEFPRDPGTFAVFNTGAGVHWVAADEAVAEEGSLPNNCDGFKVRGDSMWPVAQDGQTVLVERGVEARDGDLAIVQKMNGVRVFKRVRFKGKHVILESVNPAYAADLTLRTEIVRMTRVWGVKF